MIDRLRQAGRRVRSVWAGVVVALLIPVLVVRVVGFGFGLLLRGRWVRWRFRRTLQRSDLTPQDVQELAALYDPTIPVRDIFRQRKLFRS